MSPEPAAGTPGPGAVSDRLRALLSRAAEEQLHEQRQVSAVLGELRALLQDVDGRAATGEQVERVAAGVRELSARVEVRLDGAQARADELAQEVRQATAAVGQLVQDVHELLEGSERRLAAHVDDAVLALAEVVLRRRRPAAAASEPEERGEAAPVGDGLAGRAGAT